MLSQDVERYVDLQRSLGFKFGDQSCSLRLLPRMPCLTATSSSVWNVSWPGRQCRQLRRNGAAPGRAGSPLRARHARRKPAA